MKYWFSPSGDWISFKEIRGGNIFFPAFQDSNIRLLVESFQRNPEGLIENLVEHFRGKIVEGSDVAVELTTFP
jgi:hypothetical protein